MTEKSGPNFDTSIYTYSLTYFVIIDVSMAKIVSLNKAIKAQEKLLSKPMIISLLTAYYAQQQDFISAEKVTGSLTILIRRGLVKGEFIFIDGQFQHKWLVTPKAVQLLLSMGFDLDSPQNRRRL